MSTPKILIALLLLSTGALAADPAPAAHWYQVTVTGVTSSTMLTGSSPLEAAQLASKLNGNETIILENIREIFMRPGDQGMTWHPASEVTRVFIPARSILFMSELHGDPVIAGK